MNKTDKLKSVLYSIEDAKQAMLLAIEIRNWDNVNKYANQLKELDREHYDLTVVYYGKE